MMMIRALAGIVLSFVMGEHNLIVDTDAGFDVDDVAAIAVANKLANERGENRRDFSCERVHEGNWCVSVVVKWYNRSTRSLGFVQGEWARDPHAGTGNADKYVSDLVDHYPSRVNASDQVEAVRVYRKALVEASDGSVSIASIGITTNMRDLVLSEPDDISPLSGMILSHKKFRKLFGWTECTISVVLSMIRSIG